MGEKVRWENSMQEARGGNGAPAPAYLCAARGFRGNRKEQLIVDQTVLRPESGHFPLFPLRVGGAKLDQACGGKRRSVKVLRAERKKDGPFTSLNSDL